MTKWYQRIINKIKNHKEELPKFEVIEILKTRQGEGKYQGLPIVLMRMAGCNLRCVWNTANRCDSEYTWEFHSNVAEEVTSEEAVKRVSNLMGDGRKTIMITGGEPMLWQNNAGWIDMLRRLKKKGYLIHIETNGTVKVNSESAKYIDFFDISPKASLYPSMYNRDNVSSYLGTEHVWKFVVSSRFDILNIISFLANVGLKEKPNEPIYLMGLGANKQQLHASMQYITDEGLGLLKANGINARMSARQQVEENFL